MNNFVTTSQAAKILGVSDRRIRAMVESGLLPNTQTVGVPGRLTHLISRSDLNSSVIKNRKSGRPKKK